MIMAWQFATVRVSLHHRLDAHAELQNRSSCQEITLSSSHSAAEWTHSLRGPALPGILYRYSADPKNFLALFPTIGHLPRIQDLVPETKLLTRRLWETRQKNPSMEKRPTIRREAVLEQSSKARRWVGLCRKNQTVSHGSFLSPVGGNYFLVCEAASVTSSARQHKYLGSYVYPRANPRRSSCFLLTSSFLFHSSLSRWKGYGWPLLTARISHRSF